MPLMQRSVNEKDLVVVEVDGDTYWLKPVLNWWEAAKAAEQRGIVFHVKGERIRKNLNLFGNDDIVPVTIESSGAATLQKIRTYLVKWSHSEPMSEENIKLLPLEHATAIMSKIRELEKVQRGPSEDSPLES